MIQCRNCIYWNPPEAGAGLKVELLLKGFGECSYADKQDSARMMRTEGTSNWLYTLPEFGCVAGDRLPQ